MSEHATLGGGCYWCLEAIYQRVKGVTKVISGYSGGHSEHPTATEVYGGDTGHAEVVQVTFEPEVITYKEILEIFFVMHDPTTLNRQDYDEGEWYRSIVLYDSTEQKKIAEDTAKNYAAKIWDDPIVTQIVPLDKFWPAEADMQNFYNSRPEAGYCQMIINPKIIKLRQKFAERYLPGPDD